MNNWCFVNRPTDNTIRGMKEKEKTFYGEPINSEGQEILTFRIIIIIRRAENINVSQFEATRCQS